MVGNCPSCYSVGELDCQCINCGKNVYREIVLLHPNGLWKIICARDLVLVAYGIKAVLEDAYKNMKIIKLPSIRTSTDWGYPRNHAIWNGLSVITTVGRVIDVIEHINQVDLNDRSVQKQLMRLLISTDQEILQTIMDIKNSSHKSNFDDFKDVTTKKYHDLL